LWKGGGKQVLSPTCFLVSLPHECKSFYTSFYPPFLICSEKSVLSAAKFLQLIMRLRFTVVGNIKKQHTKNGNSCVEEGSDGEIKAQLRRGDVCIVENHFKFTSGNRKNTAAQNID
jgi:hypothetical protein